MNRELFILLTLSDNPLISQRELGRLSGLSLGTVNAVLKGMEESGIIDYQLEDGKKPVYHLTDSGNSLKNKLILQEVTDSYQFISRIKGHLKKRLSKKLREGYQLFYLYGRHDEMYKLLKMCLIELKQTAHFSYLECDSLELELDEKAILLLWDESDEQFMKDGIIYLNLLK